MYKPENPAPTIVASNSVAESELSPPLGALIMLISPDAVAQELAPLKADQSRIN
jgi:hypothetical protein